MTPEQLSTLPKWAQDEINVLQANIKSLTANLDAFNGDTDTNTFIQEGLSERPLQNYSCILFTTGIFGRNRFRVRIDRDGSLSINGHSDMGQTMIIQPRASNSLHVGFID